MDGINEDEIDIEAYKRWKEQCEDSALDEEDIDSEEEEEELDGESGSRSVNFGASDDD